MIIMDRAGGAGGQTETPPEDCSWEENLCDWTDRGEFKWKRQQTNEITFGPEQDHNGNQESK